MATSFTLPAWLRDPRYTGPNRCLPCTAVNVVIAAAIALLVATVSVPGALLVFGASVATISVRGYLVPGTPTLTKRYLPDRVLAWFDKGPARSTAATVAAGAGGSGGDAETGAPFDPGARLVDAGVLFDDPAVDDYVLEPAFHVTWTDRARELADADGDAAALARFLEVDADSIDLVDRGYVFAAALDGEWIGQWESRSAFIVDVAAAEVLAERWGEWAGLPTAQRSELLGGLRLFVEDCPTCDGSVTLGTTVVESCCRQYDVLAATCDDCGARLFEADVDPEALERVAGTA
ncbi:hypothetical protein GRS48_04795 [Halorubrum sp. JWXQ-INN 858]|uniref:hypothetical protein n=1 Tax=Halorubrum sp. JWXQ-INN 858 TaxID=2690782 RepID=UPI00135A97E9|nr:hypothetical protein [Halorubrum sp. JWXQ-INN 858]MWV64141.1 hypothetical protein [Halorubrum sp. JWXQ-INN 858]